MPNDTLELPQVFSRTVGPIQPVSQFEGYSPERMQRAEGNYQGGWVPFTQDPISQAIMAGGGAYAAGLPGMFHQLAQNYGPQMVPSAQMEQPSVMRGYRPGWVRIPNSTEPEMGSSRTQVGLPQGDMTQTMGVRETQFGGPYHPMTEALGEPRRIPVQMQDGTIIGLKVDDLLRQHASPEGLTAGGALVPIPEQQPLRITEPVPEQYGKLGSSMLGGTGRAVMPAIGSIPGEDTYLTRGTQPLSHVYLYPSEPTPVFAGGRLTQELPTLADLFRRIPE